MAGPSTQVTKNIEIRLTDSTEFFLQIRSPQGNQVGIENYCLTLHQTGKTEIIVTDLGSLPPDRNESLLYLNVTSSKFKVIEPNGKTRDASEEDIDKATVTFRNECPHLETIVAGSSLAEMRLRCKNCGVPIKNIYDYVKE
jgi:hypothetical protein